MTTPIGQDFATNITDFKTDIASLKQNITDSLLVGKAAYGPYGHAEVTKDVSDRTAELTKRKDKLREDIQKQEAVINRSDRDFTDVRDTLPETLPNNRFRFMEDYTLVFLLIAYLFMMVVALHVYVTYSPEPWSTALVYGLFYSIMITLFAGLILYYMC